VKQPIEVGLCAASAGNGIKPASASAKSGDRAIVPSSLIAATTTLQPLTAEAACDDTVPPLAYSVPPRTPGASSLSHVSTIPPELHEYVLMSVSIGGQPMAQVGRGSLHRDLHKFKRRHFPALKTAGQKSHHVVINSLLASSRKFCPDVSAGKPKIGG
jgi:hypothetical protein